MASRHVFLTGFPGFIARRLLRRLLTSDDSVRVSVLCEHSSYLQAQGVLAQIREQSSTGIVSRVRLLTGDISAMDVGLSGPEFRTLSNEITEVYHLAAVHKLGVDRGTAERVNVQGTANVLDLARSMQHLERFVHVSSAYVCGNRQGVILEEELECGQSFRNPYEATKHAAEVLVRRAMEDLPVTIIRPSSVVGDSKTGEIDRFEGVYYIGILLAASPVPIPFPGQGSAPLNVVPVDYLIDAIHAIVQRTDTISRTFHVVDPNPLSVRHIYSLVAKSMGRRSATPRYGVSPNLTKALLRIPGLERIAPLSHQFIDYLDQMVFYNSRNTQQALEGTGIRCPPFEDYVDNLIQYVRDYFGSSITPA